MIKKNTKLPVNEEISCLEDKRINAKSVILEISIGDYCDLSQEILKNNEFQRRRVRSSGSVYNLLKQDLKRGCIIPPIVLALSTKIAKKSYATKQDILKTLKDNIKSILILDGLQRTYTIQELIAELVAKKDPDIKKVRNYNIRIELYLGINRLGILYRMLTLNSGQTPMSSRHQIEIIYSDYASAPRSGISLLREIDETKPEILHEYKFSDIIDGFTSYIERDYLAIDRNDILDNIKSLEKLANEESADLFEDFLTSYDILAMQLVTNSAGWKFPEAEYKRYSGQPFFRTQLKLINKSQVLTGFGSAIGKLIDNEEIKSVSETHKLIAKINKDSINPGLNEILFSLGKIRAEAKKIGNEQRLYFHQLFRSLFTKSSDGYLNLEKASQDGFRQYERIAK